MGSLRECSRRLVYHGRGDGAKQRTSILSRFWASVQSADFQGGRDACDLHQGYNFDDRGWLESRDYHRRISTDTLRFQGYRHYTGDFSLVVGQVTVHLCFSRPAAIFRAPADVEEANRLRYEKNSEKVKCDGKKEDAIEWKVIRTFEHDGGDVRVKFGFGYSFFYEEHILKLRLETKSTLSR